jgi:hypothetical protein
MQRGYTPNMGRCDAHEEVGYLYNYKGTGSSGPYTHLWYRPSISSAPNPGLGIMPNNPRTWDNHGTYENNNTTDTTPLGLSNDDVPKETYAMEGNAPYYDEFDLVTTDGSGTTYRMNHIYATGTSPNYSEQNNFSSISQDGYWALITSDMMNTRGNRSSDWVASHAYLATNPDQIFPLTNNTNGYGWYASTSGTSAASGSEPNWDSCSTTCADGTGSLVWTREPTFCNQLRGMYAPTISFSFPAGSYMYDHISSNVYYTAAGGTSASSSHVWNTFCPNYGTCPTLDGTIQWVNEGSNDCRSDVFLVDLMSAH